MIGRDGQVCAAARSGSMQPAPSASIVPAIPNIKNVLILLMRSAGTVENKAAAVGRADAASTTFSQRLLLLTQFLHVPPSQGNMTTGQ